MRDKQILVRMSEAEIAALGLLTGGASREEWIRGQIRGAITRRLLFNVAAINDVLQEAEAAVAHGEDDSKYRHRIAEYESEQAILLMEAV